MEKFFLKGIPEGAPKKGSPALAKKRGGKKSE